MQSAGCAVLVFGLLAGCTERGGHPSQSSGAGSDSTPRYVPLPKPIIGTYQIEDLSLQATAAWLTLRGTSDTSVWRTALCADYVVSANAVSLRCEDTPIGTVTVQGRFTDQRKHALSALVTAERARRIVYRRSHTFTARAQ